MDRLFSFSSIFTFLLVSALFVSWYSPGAEEELAFTVVKVCNAPALYSNPAVCDANSTNIVPNPNGGPTMIPLDIHVANLIPNGNGTFRLPDGVPAMYVAFDNTNGQTQMVGPVTTFYYEGQVEGWPVYMAIVDLPFDFGSTCNGSTVATANSNARLVTGFGQFYPIHNYSAVNGMFSCKVFSETCFNCDPSCAGNNQNPEADLYFCIDCGGERSHVQVDDQLSDSAWMAAVRANPFLNDLVLDLSIQEATEVSVEIYTQTGVLAYQSKALLEAGKQPLSIDTGKWQTGSYYCKVSSPHFSKTFTLMKM